MAKARKKDAKIEKNTETKIDFKKLFGENAGLLVIILGIAAIVIIALFFMKASTNFEYNGVEFNKRASGSIKLYTAKIPIQDYFGNIIEYRQVDFRNNPRDLKNVNLVYNDTIRFLEDRKIYISYGNLSSCEDTVLAGANFGIFMYTIGLDYKAAIDDIAYINSTNSPYVNCDTHPFNTVIYIHAGNETKISKRMSHCYDIQYKNCEILPALEKFELIILEQYMAGLAN